MAKISTIKEALEICREAKVTPFIWGHRGLGKSSLVQQVAAEQNMGFIDLRCSQLEASDVRGLPDRVNGRTAYLPPVDMPIGDMTPEQIADELGEVPDSNDLEAERVFLERLQQYQARFQKGILFIDEVNRAQDDVLQAIFQLVLDRRVGSYVLPPGWAVVAAGNYMEGYTVSGFTSDPAFVNRFCHLVLSGGEATVEEWVDYMSSVHGGGAAEVIEFASQNVKHLDGEVTGELGFSIQPSRRSWEMVVRVDEACKRINANDSTRTEVIAGLIGRELALSFIRYSCPVKPRDILTHGVARYEEALSKLNRNQLTGLMWGVVSFAKNQLDDDAVATVCLDFTEFLAKNQQISDKDIVVAFCRALVSSGANPNDAQEKVRTAVISNPRLAQMISKFGKKNGTKKNFIDRLSERPELQRILSRVSWGVDEETEAPKTEAKTKKK